MDQRPTFSYERLFICILLLSVFTAEAKQARHSENSAKAKAPATRSQSGESSALLPDGRTLVAGGFGADSRPIRDALIISADGSVSKLAGMNVSRAGHTATVLPDGTVFIFGGVGADGNLVTTSELYDTDSQTFSVLPNVVAVPRAFHSATLLTDGNLLLAGGVLAGGEFPDDVQLWDYRTRRALSQHALLSVPRENHSAVLLSNGTVHISGGTDHFGRPASLDEIYDSVTTRFRFADEGDQQAEGAAETSLGIAASVPEDRATDVPVQSSIAIRFTRLLDVKTVNPGSFTLLGPDGTSVAATITPAEAGRLVFLLPASPLQPGTTYVLKIQGAADASGEQLPGTSITFQTAGAPPDGTGPDWVPGPGWSSGTGGSKWQQLPPLQARPGETALAGQTLKLNGWPLHNVTLEMDGKHTRTDGSGRFLLKGLTAGRHVLWIDGSSANHEDAVYGTYEVGVTILPGKTNVLNYTIWMTKLDMVHAVNIPSPTNSEIVLTNPTLPGLELHLPPNTTITDRYGKTVHQVSITPIPLDKPPFPLPGGVQVPIYFTVQPGGAYIAVSATQDGPKGARLIYPNAFNLRPGTPFDFWNYDADARGWFIYGQGKVSADGRNIFPNPGVVIYEFTGAMVGSVGAGMQGCLAGKRGCTLASDPVSLQTGQFIYTKTDLVLPDTVPINFTRTYVSNDSRSRAFGIGATDSYDFFMVGDIQPYTFQELVEPTGARIRFDRVSVGTGEFATYVATTAPGEFYGAVLSRNVPNASFPGWVITLKNGTILAFQDGAGATSPFCEAVNGIQDRYGNLIRIDRDPSTCVLTKVTSPNGRYITVTNDSSSRITKITDNSGRTVNYSYDTAGRLSTVTDVGAGVTTYTYDDQNRMLTITDPRNISYLANQYDSSGRVIQQTQADGGVYQFAWTPTTNTTQTHFYAEADTSEGGGGGVSGKPMVLPCYDMSTNRFDQGPYNRYDPNCLEGYMPLMAQVDVTDPRGYVRRVNFGPTGYMTSDTHALGQPEQQTVTYNNYSDNLQQSVTDALGRVTSFDYDGFGNVTRVTRLDGTQNAVTSTFSYAGPFGQLSSATDPLGHSSTFSYDQNGNLTTATDALNHSTTFTYNSAGQVTSATDALNNQVQFGYFGGDLSTVIDPLGNVSAQFTDSLGRVISATDAQGNTTQTQYNAFNLVTQVTDALGNNTSFTYDGNGNLLSLTDALNHATSWTYSNMDRPATRQDPLQRQASYTYDLNGNLASRTDRKGQVTSFSYDGLNRPTLIGYNTVVNGGVTSYESTTSYTYDAGNRLTQVADSAGGGLTKAYDNLDRLTSETAPLGSVAYGYDNGGRLTAKTINGQPQITLAYDNANRLTLITQGSSNVSFSYDNANRRSSLTLPNGISVSYSYDNDSHVTGISYSLGSTTLGNLTYSYDQLGRRSQIGGSFARTSLPAAVTSAAYDAGNQLKNWNGSAITYDANGNMLSDGANTFTWNARNQVAALNSVSLQYDAGGRRTKNAAGTSFLFDGANSTQESSGSTVTANILTGGTDESFQRSDSNGTVVPLADALGSTIALADSSGNIQTTYSYDPFGNTTLAGAPSNNPSQFTGRENEGSGLYYYRARYYSPVLHRFVSQDPLGMVGSGPNAYRYAGNSPTNFRDPSGKCLVMGLLNTIPFNISVIYQSLAGRKAMYYGGWEGAGHVLAGNVEAFGNGCSLGLLGEAVAAAESAEVIAVVEEEMAEDSTTEALQKIVDQASERFDQEGFTEAQEDALLDNPDLEPAFKGERIDFYTREIAGETGLPEGIQMTPRGVSGPDFFDPATGDWWDVTTPGQWLSHVAQYGSGGTILIY